MDCPTSVGGHRPPRGIVARVDSSEVHYVDRHQKMRFEYEKGTKDLEAREERLVGLGSSFLEQRLDLRFFVVSFGGRDLGCQDIWIDELEGTGWSATKA